MHRQILAFAIASAACALAAPPASAVMCYRLIDRNDNVVYQDIYPPVDLSEKGAEERKALRARNEHMIAMETDRCPRLEFLTGGGGAGRLNFEELTGDSASNGTRTTTPTAPRAAAPAKRTNTPAPASPKAAPAKSADKPAAPPS